MLKEVLTRLVILILCIVLITLGGYLLIKEFYNAKYYHRYLESPVYAWNQMRTIELAGISSNALNEVYLNANVMAWAYNQPRVDWLIRLFRYKELTAKEKENKTLLCDLQTYRKKHPMLGNYYEPLLSKFNKEKLYKQQREAQAIYIETLTNAWQKILTLPCGAN